MAVKEAVHNIIKHATASEVTIRMAFTGGFLDVSVHDDGAGFQPSDNIPGNGLTNMKQRGQNNGGTWIFESGSASGATVLMRLGVRAELGKKRRSGGSVFF